VTTVETLLDTVKPFECHFVIVILAQNKD